MSSPGLQGLRPWIIQRVSAVYIALFVLYFFFLVFFNKPLSVTEWQSWVAAPFNNLALALFFIAVLWHAWIGVRDIVLDYVPNVIGRLFALTLVFGTILASGLWGLKALFMVLVK